MASYENLSSKNEDDDDMLNNLLPEHVVSDILSRLPTAEAIKTSILSKRWRSLWTTISTLDFSSQTKNLEKYVNAVILQLNPTYSVDKFSLFLWSYSNVLQIENWISFAVERNVKDLTLQTCNNDRKDLPCKLFDCKSLEALRLYRGFHLKIPKRGFVCFPNLKLLNLERVSISGIPAEENSPCFPQLVTLRLRSVKFVEKDDYVMKLIRNCPLLEDLSIRRVLEHNVSNMDLSISQLTTLGLTCGEFMCVGLNVQIEAPIKYLTISDWNPTHRIIVKNRDSLIRAGLSFDSFRSYDFQGEQRDELLKILKTVDKVKYLSLSAGVTVAIKASSIRLPLFSNLIRLKLALDCKDFYTLECLLNNTFSLQNLVIYKVPPFGQYICIKKGCIEEDGRWSELSHVPKCVLSSLKRIQIVRSTNCAGEVEMIKNMLNSAKVLEKLIWTGSGMSRNLRGKISTFPRASASCQFDFPTHVTFT